MADKILGTEYIGERETKTISIQYDDYSTVTVSAVYVFRNNTDVTSTVMPSGSHSVSNNVLTMKPITAINGGDTYLIDISVTVPGGDIVQRWIEVKGIKNETGRVRNK